MLSFGCLLNVLQMPFDCLLEALPKTQTICQMQIYQGNNHDATREPCSMIKYAKEATMKPWTNLHIQVFQKSFEDLSTATHYYTSQTRTMPVVCFLSDDYH